MNLNFRISEVTVVPPMVVAILMSPLTQTKPFLKHAKYAICGAAPLDKELQERFLKLMSPGASFNQVWGMTETSCVATRFVHSEHDNTGSVGRPIPNVELKYVPGYASLMPFCFFIIFSIGIIDIILFHLLHLYRFAM